MNIKKRLQGFTLVEVTITIVIMGMLIGLIFQIFVTIGRISVFVQLNRTVHSELIYLTQTIQNMVDDQNMQLTGFVAGSGGDILSNGRKQQVIFADMAYKYNIVKNCIPGSNCFIELQRIELNPDYLGGDVDSGSVALTDPNLINVDSFLIRTLPYGSPGEYDQIMHEGFWLLVDMRVPQYDATRRRYRVQQQTQLFFTMRKYD